MCKNVCYLKTLAILSSLVLLMQNVQAQELTDARHVYALISKNAVSLHMSSDDRANSRISNAYYSKQSGVLLVYLQQTYKGIDVYNAIKVLAFKDDKLVSLSGGAIPKMAARVNNADGTPSLMAENAVSAAAQYLNIPVQASFTRSKGTGDTSEVDFGDLGISSESVKAKLLWMPSDNGQRVILCWQVQIQPSKSPDHWLIRVNAKDGSFVNKDNLTVKCNWHKPGQQHSAECYEVQHYDKNDALPMVAAFKDPSTINSAKYRVVPFPAEAPSFAGGTPALVTDPWLLASAGNNATSLKWNDNGTSTFAISRGNNVYAQEDHDANNNTIGQSAKSKTALPDLDFDYLPNLDGEPKDSLNQGFSLTNLFYWSNIMHDITYQYGFDEVSGNFQESNQGRGGKGNDYVIADGQDATDLDNSNFATPPDGQSPRMQMYLFDYAIFNVCYINAPAANAGYDAALEGAFSTANTLAANGPITADVALYKGTGGSNTACTVATNADELKGKIALIYRSTCNFVDKVKNAQNAGAIGVIMYDSIPDNGTLVRMGGTDNTITIPAVFISNSDGLAMKALLTAGKTVNVTLKIHYMDGSLDAGVMCHEYTHGISNRLTGGPAITTCLQNAEQMGEGWSDYYALMVTTDWSTAKVTDGTKPRPLGTYVVDELPTGGGIRTYPYSTDITIDKWRYDSLKTNTDGGEVHLIGEIWTTALWEMTWAIIQQDNLVNPHLHDATAAGGNTVALKLVTEGLKLQPCSPGFIDGRNAILKADTLLYNGKYSCAIWKAFAKRGMGIKASQGSSKSINDQTVDYSIPGSAAITKHSDRDSAAQEQVVTYTITPTCRCADLTNLKIVDTLPTTVTYVSGGTYNSTNRTVTFSGINLAASQSKSFSVQVKVNKGSYFAPTNLFSDSVKTSTIPAANWQNQSTTSTTWKVSTGQHNSGSYSYFAADSSNITNESLVTKNAYQLTGVSTLSFWHFFDTEEGYDGGVVEISTDNGTTWADLGPYMTSNGYNNSIDPTTPSVLAGRAAFSGSTDEFINTVINLASFTGKKVMIRFTFASDDINGGNGWYIDDIVLKSRALVYNRVQLYSSTDSLQSTADTVTAIKNFSLPVTWGSFTVEKQNNTAKLAWKTLQELNTAKFVVERSGDGAKFYEIGTVQASGNSTFSVSYQYVDATPIQGINYYRLRQVDKDGQFEYSDVRTLTFNGVDGLVSISPNPAKDKISITIPGNTKALKVYLVNSAGQQLHVYDMAGQNLQLNLFGIAAGVYYVRIEGDGVSSQHKLVVE